jgi:methionyl-tRNA synthetase
MTSSDAASPILVAVAWPYANGPLHLGHIAGSLLPPDIFARYQRMRGRLAVMVSGSDMHGTPITVAAEKEGISPGEFAARSHALHVEALRALDVHFDLFTSTATRNHADVTQEIFRRLLANGYIDKRSVTAPFDAQAKRFLPDRYVEGECPHCHAPDARGDQCDSCGRTLDPQDLLKPRSKLTGATPEFRDTEHFFLLLSKLEPDLRAWVESQADKANWRSTVRNFTERWLAEGLKDRAITRDLTYGVDIPSEAGEYPDKRIYVWFDAVIGYLSAAIEWAQRGGDPEAWKPLWRDGVRGFYFLGKDNIPFHTIIWPAMLLGHNKGPGHLGHLPLPWDLPANEFLQFKGAKFSKSRGNAFYVLDILKHFDADAVRYYLAATMPERADTDWTWPDFVSKVNDELVATVGNYANRVLALCEKNWGSLPPESPGAIAADELARLGAPLEEAIVRSLAEEAAFIEDREFRKALRAVVGLASHGNRSLDQMAPWSLVKRGDAGLAQAATWLRLHLVALRALAFGLQPFLPAMSEALWQQLGDARAGGPESLRAIAETHHIGVDGWPKGPANIPAEGKLGAIKPLVRKLDLEAVLAEFAPPAEDAAPEAPAAPKKPAAKAAAPKEGKAAEKAPAAPDAARGPATFEDFAKLELRVGVVKSVEDHPGAERIYVLQVDLGTETRQVLAGVRKELTREALLGRRVVIVANLAPRKIRGLVSEGMMLVAEADGKLEPITVGEGLPPGASVR